MPRLKSKLEPFLDQIKKKYLTGDSTEQLALEYGVTGPVIRKFLKRLGVPLRKSKLEGKEQEVTEKYLAGLSSIQLAESYGVSKPTILTLLKDQKVERRNRSQSQQKYTIDEHVFDCIDSEEKAYWLGFLYADGNNSPSVRTITLQIHKRDRDILKKLKFFLKSDAPIKKVKSDSTLIRFTVTNKHLSSKLEELGIVQAKTFKLTFPKWLSTEFQKPFIRGYFDGDGGISSVNTADITFSVTGTVSIVRTIQSILMKECDLPETELDERYPERQTSIRTCRYSGRVQVLRILNYLYEDASVFLERKYQTYLALKHSTAQQKREYNEKHCWQYQMRLESLEKDLQKFNMTQKEINQLRIADFYFTAIEKPTKKEYTEFKNFIISCEWLGRMPNRPSHYFTVRWKKNHALAGVLIMSVPNMTSHLLGRDNIHLERLISRGACASWTPKNLASWLVMKSISWMVKNTQFRMFTAYADPEAREIGTIYQACNFYYLGRNHRKAQKLYFDPEQPIRGWFSERHFTHKSAYIRYINKLELHQLFFNNPEWFKNYSLNWDLIPDDIARKIKDEIKQYKESCVQRETEPKHKYVYILGSTKKETKALRKLFACINKKKIKTIYPKR